MTVLHPPLPRLAGRSLPADPGSITDDSAATVGELFIPQQLDLAGNRFDHPQQAGADCGIVVAANGRRPNLVHQPALSVGINDYFSWMRIAFCWFVVEINPHRGQ